MYPPISKKNIREVIHPQLSVFQVTSDFKVYTKPRLTGELLTAIQEARNWRPVCRTQQDIIS
jgi:hypothetical protein